MKEFNFLFGLMLAEKLLKHSNNISRKIQVTSMPAIEAHHSYENGPGLRIILEAVSKYTNITECRRPRTAKEAEETKIL